MDAKQAAEIINNVEDGWTIVAVAVPTRGLRVTISADQKSFRVQQLMPGEGYRWDTIAFHAGDFPWESWGPALEDMIAKQARLKEKIKLAQRNARQAVA